MIFPVCSCDTCKQMCRHPCLPTPYEAIKLIEAGYGARLSYFSTYASVHDNSTFCTLRPAKKGEEGWKREAKYIDYTYWDIRCTFQDETTGLCELHDLGLKPIEAKLAIHGGRPDYLLSDIRDRIEAAWNNAMAQEIVREWANLYCKDECLLTNLAE